MNPSETLGQEDTSKLLRVVKALGELEDAEPFLLPVDYEGLGLQDYLQVVTRPMDLSTIQGKLKGRKYSLVGEVLQDLQLIWDNCRLYNAAGSAIVQHANRMERHTARLCHKYKVGRKSEDGNRLKFDEKAAFCELVKQVPYEVLEDCLVQTRERCPAAAEVLDQDRVQIRVDLLDRPTFTLLFEMLKQATDTPSKHSRLD